MSKLVRNNDGKIIKIRVENAVVSYPYLIAPRPEGRFKTGSYSAELIVFDEETISLVKQYVREVADAAVKLVWNDRIPATLNLPYRLGDEDNEIEAGGFVLKTGSPKFQPKLLIRDPQSGRAHELTEDEIGEFYAGMIADADVTLKAYNFNGIAGITAYLNAICKVGEGTPIAAMASIEDSFSTPSAFDAEPQPQPAKPAKATTKPQSAKSLDDLLGAATEQKATEQKATEQKAAEPKVSKPQSAVKPKGASLDDLLQTAPKGGQESGPKDSVVTLDDLLK